MSGSADSFTEVTSKSWFGRLRDSFIGVLIGLVLLGLGVAMLLWNEKNELQSLRSLSFGAANVVEAEASRVDPSLEGKLVHVTGVLAAPGPAKDSVFGAVAADAVRLARHVEMYQWEEKSSSTTEKSIGGSSTTTTTYSYDRTWSGSALDSSHFHVPANHENPPMNFRDETVNAADAAVGSRKLDAAVLNKFSRFSPVSTPSGAAPGGWSVSGAGFAHGDPANPAVGDVRVTFSEVASGPASVVAGQRGDRLVAFPTPSGASVALAVAGAEPAAAMFGEARSSARGLAWGLRGGGFLLILIGLFLLVRPLAVLVSVLPVLESVVDFAGFIAVFGLAVLITLATVAIAHMYLQPLLSGALVLAGVVVFGVCARLRGKRTATAR